MRKLTDVKIWEQADAYFDYLQKHTPVSDELRAAELLAGKMGKLLTPFTLACEAERKKLGDDVCRCATFAGHGITKVIYDQVASHLQNLSLQRSNVINRQVNIFKEDLFRKQHLIRRLKQKRRGQI
jgi:hypothetical protein